MSKEKFEKGIFEFGKKSCDIDSSIKIGETISKIPIDTLITFIDRTEDRVGTFFNNMIFIGNLIRINGIIYSLDLGAPTTLDDKTDKLYDTPLVISCREHFNGKITDIDVEEYETGHSLFYSWCNTLAVGPDAINYFNLDKNRQGISEIVKDQFNVYKKIQKHFANQEIVASTYI